MVPLCWRNTPTCERSSKLSHHLLLQSVLGNRQKCSPRLKKKKYGTPIDDGVGGGSRTQHRKTLRILVSLGLRFFSETTPIDNANTLLAGKLNDSVNDLRRGSHTRRIQRRVAPPANGPQNHLHAFHPRFHGLWKAKDALTAHQHQRRHPPRGARPDEDRHAVAVAQDVHQRLGDLHKSSRGEVERFAEAPQKKTKTFPPSSGPVHPPRKRGEGEKVEHGHRRKTMATVCAQARTDTSQGTGALLLQSVRSRAKTRPTPA